MNLRVVRKKTKSIKNVRKITKAMQMVSAVKMKKAQLLEHESRPYRDGLSELIAKIGGKVDPEYADLLRVDLSNAKRKMVVVISSNKGLAGSFNMNIFRHLLKSDIKFEQTDFITVGSKVAQFLSRIAGTNIIADFSNGNPQNDATAIFSLISEKYFTGMYSEISILYNKFISTLKSEIGDVTLLPINLTFKNQEAVSAANSTEYLIEPTPNEILEELLRSYLEQQIRGAVISSEAVEHSARMMAMKSATDNATELIYDLTLLSNRLRQEKITNELLDMITAKESVDTGQ